MQRRSRSLTSRICLMLCLIITVTILLHLNFMAMRHFTRLQHSSSTPTLISLRQNGQAQVLKEQPQRKVHRRLPRLSSAFPPLPSSSPPPPSPPTTPLEPVVVFQSDLTILHQYPDGTRTKIFKPAFYNDPVAARQELGSFMETLATRSWPSSSGGRSGSGEQEGGDQEMFFTYLPIGGEYNQFVSLQKAALLAKDLGRTLLLPPISPSSRVKEWSGPPYSQFYDLQAFSQKSGIHILEWHTLKQTPETFPQSLVHQWEQFSEPLPCIPNGGIGLGHHGRGRGQNLYDHFRQQFLLQYIPTLPEGHMDRTLGRSTHYRYVRDVLLKDKTFRFKGEDASMPMSALSKDPSQLFKCLTAPYFLLGPDMVSRPWEEVGLYWRFNAQVEALVDDILDKILGPVEDHVRLQQEIQGNPFRPHPDFIVIHLHRGETLSKCGSALSQLNKDCSSVQVETIAAQVEWIEKKRRQDQAMEEEDNRPIQPLPVLVVTDEGRPEELIKMVKLGWVLIDHGDKDPEKPTKLGTLSALGPWHPPILDAALLTRGAYFIGMRQSRMSTLASQRGMAWYGQHAVLL